MKKQKEIPVLDFGFVRLTDFCGGDLNVINAARVSFGKQKDELDNSDAKLINYLLKNKHGSPFAHSYVAFHIKAPIFVFREWVRHRVGISYNEQSLRYTEIEPEFYIPEVQNIRKRVGKAGAYTYEPMEEKDATWFRVLLSNQSVNAGVDYKRALKIGVAPEQARMLLPVNTYSEIRWTVNPRSLMHFLSLRNNEQAQWEIREYARVMEDIWKTLMPITEKCFSSNDRIAP